MENAIQFIFSIVILIFSVVIHEVSHGYAALAQGDKTAQDAGRLTLNPIRHLDPFGSIVLPVLSYFVGGFVFGWAKPVPYNPYNLRNHKWGDAIVAMAGPLSNVSLALIFGLLIRFLGGAAQNVFLTNFINIAGTIVLLNLVLAFFNLVPIPPLDGSKILFSFLPYRWRHVQNFLEQYGFFIFILFIFFLSGLILPAVSIAFRLITGGFP